MSVKLTKGQRVNLRKDAPNLKRIMVGLGWDPVKPVRSMFSSTPDIDIDASVICIDESGKKKEVVYYGNKEDRARSILHGGDNLTGDGDGDDETIDILLDEVPANIVKLAIIINIYSAYSRRQDFGKVKNCFVHVDDKDTGKELCRYDIDGNFDGKTGIFVADIYRNKGEWKFQAIGDGVKVANISEMVQMKCR